MATLCNNLATVDTNRVTQIMPVFFFDQRVNGPGVHNTALTVYNSVHAQEKNIAKSVPSNKALAPRVWYCQHHRPDDSQIIQGKFVTSIHKVQFSLHGNNNKDTPIIHYKGEIFFAFNRAPVLDMTMKLCPSSILTPSPQCLHTIYL